MLNELRTASDYVALEAYHTEGINLGELLRKVYPNITKAFTSFINVFNPGEPGITLTSKSKDLIRVVSKIAYADINQITAYVPEGMDASYLNYSSALLSVASHAAEVQSLLGEYSTYLAMLINNKEQALSTSNNIRLYKARQKTREDFQKLLGGFFKNGSYQTEVPYGRVLARNNDWPLVYSRIEDLTKLTNSVDRKALNKKIVETIELMDTVIKMIKNDELGNVGPEVVSELAEGAFQIASELEFFSNIYYRTLALTTAINRTTDTLVTSFQN